jgi:hypothetical protein
VKSQWAFFFNPSSVVQRSFSEFLLCQTGFFDSRFFVRMLVSQSIDVTHLFVHHSKRIFIFGTLVALIGSKNGTFTLTKNQVLGLWFPAAVIRRPHLVMSFESQLCLAQIWSLWAIRSGSGFCPQVCSKDLRCLIGFLILFITPSISWPLVQIPLRSLQGMLNFKIIQNSATAALRGSRVWPWASRNLIWWPKKILKQHQEISEYKSVLNINGTPDHVSTDSRFSRGNSISCNNCQIFGISGQNCKRDFLSFPSKFENVSWEYSLRLWFKAARLLSASGPSPLPFLIILASSHRRFFREVALRLPRNLHCLQNPLSLRCRG